MTESFSPYIYNGVNALTSPGSSGIGTSIFMYGEATNSNETEKKIVTRNFLEEEIKNINKELENLKVQMTYNVKKNNDKNTESMYINSYNDKNKTFLKLFEIRDKITLEINRLNTEISNANKLRYMRGGTRRRRRKASTRRRRRRTRR